MDVIITQIALGIGLFFLINWIGKHSMSVGYVEITLFIKDEDSPAINFLIRVLTPLAYLLIASSVLYVFSMDRYVSNFYWVNIYYILFRLGFNLVTQRGSLLNWTKQIIYWFAIIFMSYLLYEKIIRVKHNLLPDPATLANEIWIIMIVFVFQLLNKLELPKDGAVKRRDNYLQRRYRTFKSKYGLVIKINTANEVLERLSYAILIYEDFNRPRIVRILEYINLYLTKKPHSLGIMQYTSSKFINDRQSVNLGTLQVRRSYEEILASDEYQEIYCEDQILSLIINKYNPGYKYEQEVLKLSDSLKELFYKNSPDSLPLPAVG